MTNKRLSLCDARVFPRTVCAGAAAALPSDEVERRFLNMVFVFGFWRLLCTAETGVVFPQDVGLSGLGEG
jgi:hypothetical protein